MGIESILGGGIPLGLGRRGSSSLSSGAIVINNIVNQIDARNLAGPGGALPGAGNPGVAASPALASSPASSSQVSSSPLSSLSQGASGISGSSPADPASVLAAALPLIEKLLADLQQLGVQAPGVFSSVQSSPAAQTQLTGVPPKLVA